MHGRDDDDGNADENFERDRIDGCVLKIIWVKRPLINLPVQPAKYADFCRAQRFQPAVDEEILARGCARNFR